MFALKRRLYQLLVRLHPAAFRNRFAREMSLDFEDALATYGFSRLLLDATRSLARQWAAPVFSPSREQTPIPSHPLLAGQYMPLTDAPLTPFELLRGSLLFAVLLFLLSLAFSARTNRIAGGSFQGLPANQNTTTATPAAGAFRTPYNADDRRSHASSSGNSSGSGMVYIPAGILVPGVRGPLTVGSGKPSPPPHFSWIGFLLPCAIISIIVWVASLLMRRIQSAALRVAVVSLSLLAIVIAAAFVPVHTPPAHAQSRPDRHSTPAASDVKPEVLLFHPSGPISTYEVATIKPVDPNTADRMVKMPPSGTVNPLSIRRYIMDAFGAMYSSQVAGGPDWINKDSYDITGKAPAEVEAVMQKLARVDRIHQESEMRQSLLAGRFHLKYHFETRVLPVYEFVPAKGGLKITPVAAPPVRKPGDPPPALSRAGDIPSPGTAISSFNSAGLRVFKGTAIEMANLARTISNSGDPGTGDRPIVDHTGFVGHFNVSDLEWATMGNAAAAPVDAPSLSRALEENLGIKLVPTKAPVEVLVIDHIDRPSEN
jgi:uncharacterized protein (TIGR03435 family)